MVGEQAGWAYNLVWFVESKLNPLFPTSFCYQTQ